MAKPVLGSDPLARLKARAPEQWPGGETGPSGTPGDDLDAKIAAFERRLESRLAHLDAQVERDLRAAPGLDPTIERRLQEALHRLEERARRVSEVVEELQEEERQGLLESIIELGDAVQRFLSFNTYRRYLNNLGMRDRRFDVDPFGMESDARESILPYLRLLYHRWWRVGVQGIENVPDEGPALIVANHSGVLPYDGVMMAYAIEHQHPAQRMARFLAEDWVATLPFASTLIRRVGGVRGCRENAEKLLRMGELVAVFPEGVKGIGKYFHERYRLQRFGRGGFVQICIRTGAPIIPVAVIGAEEVHPVLYKINWLANALRMPLFPVSPTWPLLGPLGLVPLPSKWTLIFGEPILFDRYRPEDAENDFLVNQLKERVRSTIQEMINKQLATRRSIWFG